MFSVLFRYSFIIIFYICVSFTFLNETTWLFLWAKVSVWMKFNYIPLHVKIILFNCYLIASKMFLVSNMLLLFRVLLFRARFVLLIVWTFITYSLSSPAYLLRRNIVYVYILQLQFLNERNVKVKKSKFLGFWVRALIHKPTHINLYLIDWGV